MKPKLFAFFALCAMMLAAGCSGEPAGLVDPENAEQIFVGNDEAESGPDFLRSEFTSSDNYTLTIVEHTTHASSEFCLLRTPNGNLCLIASGAQEACGLSGYRIDYNPDGKVKCVSYLCDLD